MNLDALDLLGDLLDSDSEVTWDTNNGEADKITNTVSRAFKFQEQHRQGSQKQLQNAPEAAKGHNVCLADLDDLAEVDWAAVCDTDCLASPLHVSPPDSSLPASPDAPLAAAASWLPWQSPTPPPAPSSPLPFSPLAPSPANMQTATTVKVDPATATSKNSTVNFKHQVPLNSGATRNNTQAAAAASAPAVPAETPPTAPLLAAMGLTPGHLSAASESSACGTHGFSSRVCGSGLSSLSSSPRQTPPLPPQLLPGHQPAAANTNPLGLPSYALAPPPAATVTTGAVPESNTALALARATPTTSAAAHPPLPHLQPQRPQRNQPPAPPSHLPYPQLMPRHLTRAAARVAAAAYLGLPPPDPAAMGLLPPSSHPADHVKPLVSSQLQPQTQPSSSGAAPVARGLSADEVSGRGAPAAQPRPQQGQQQPLGFGLQPTLAPDSHEEETMDVELDGDADGLMAELLSMSSWDLGLALDPTDAAHAGDAGVAGTPSGPLYMGNAGDGPQPARHINCEAAAAAAARATRQSSTGCGGGGAMWGPGGEERRGMHAGERPSHSSVTGGTAEEDEHDAEIRLLDELLGGGCGSCDSSSSDGGEGVAGLQAPRNVPGCEDGTGRDGKDGRLLPLSPAPPAAERNAGRDSGTGSSSSSTSSSGGSDDIMGEVVAAAAAAARRRKRPRPLTGAASWMDALSPSLTCSPLSSSSHHQREHAPPPPQQQPAGPCGGSTCDAATSPLPFPEDAPLENGGNVGCGSGWSSGGVVQTSRPHATSSERCLLPCCQPTPYGSARYGAYSNGGEVTAPGATIAAAAATAGRFSGQQPPGSGAPDTAVGSQAQGYPKSGPFSAPPPPQSLQAVPYQAPPQCSCPDCRRGSATTSGAAAAAAGAAPPPPPACYWSDYPGNVPYGPLSQQPPLPYAPPPYPAPAPPRCTLPCCNPPAPYPPAAAPHWPAPPPVSAPALGQYRCTLPCCYPSATTLNGRGGDGDATQQPPSLRPGGSGACGGQHPSSQQQQPLPPQQLQQRFGVPTRQQHPQLPQPPPQPASGTTGTAAAAPANPLAAASKSAAEPSPPCSLPGATAPPPPGSAATAAPPPPPPQHPYGGAQAPSGPSHPSMMGAGGLATSGGYLCNTGLPSQPPPPAPSQQRHPYSYKDTSQGLGSGCSPYYHYPHQHYRTSHSGGSGPGGGAPLPHAYHPYIRHPYRQAYPYAYPPQYYPPYQYHPPQQQQQPHRVTPQCTSGPASTGPAVDQQHMGPQNQQKQQERRQGCEEQQQQQPSGRIVRTRHAYQAPVTAPASVESSAAAAAATAAATMPLPLAPQVARRVQYSTAPHVAPPNLYGTYGGSAVLAGLSAGVGGGGGGGGSA